MQRGLLRNFWRQVPTKWLQEKKVPISPKRTLEKSSKGLAWLQGCLAHKKQRPPRTLRYDYA